MIVIDKTTTDILVDMDKFAEDVLACCNRRGEYVVDTYVNGQVEVADGAPMMLDDFCSLIDKPVIRAPQSWQYINI